jgi:hypothetical protein
MTSLVLIASVELVLQVITVVIEGRRIAAPHFICGSLPSDDHSEAFYYGARDACACMGGSSRRRRYRSDRSTFAHVRPTTIVLNTADRPKSGWVKFKPQRTHFARVVGMGSLCGPPKAQSWHNHTS